jgi:acetyl esterase
VTIDPHFQAMIEAQAKLLAQQPPPPLDVIPPDMVRAGYRMQRQDQDRQAPKDVKTRDLRIEGAAGEIPARLYVPTGARTPSAGLVYFHGGGFCIGDLETHDGH